MSRTGEQIAPLPMRWDSKGVLRILLITSRDTGRGVMPKGRTMEGHLPWIAAGIEALEEAGVTGLISKKKIGTYRHDKTLDDGSVMPCKVHVYPMMVANLRRKCKEGGERKRRWFTVKGASKRVMENELSALLMSLDAKPRKHPVIRELLRAS